MVPLENRGRGFSPSASLGSYRGNHAWVQKEDPSEPSGREKQDSGPNLTYSSHDFLGSQLRIFGRRISQENHVRLTVRTQHPERFSIGGIPITRKDIGLKIRELVTGRPIDELQPQVLSRLSIRFSTVFGA